MSEDFKGTKWIVMSGVLSITTIITLCMVLILGQEKGGEGFVDCILRPTFTAEIPKFCPSVDRRSIRESPY
jgi:hypothetical protein